MAPTFDPISGTAVTVYAVVTAVLMEIFAPITVLPGSFGWELGMGLSAALAFMSAGVAVLYNGVDLGELSVYELAFVFISVLMIVGNQFIPIVQEYVAAYAPYTNIVLYLFGGFALFILAYGDGVKWYPFR
jgi:hypothetical protein